MINYLDFESITKLDINSYDYIAVGAGFSGSSCARVLAERGKNVLVIDSRAHIGGNAYDENDCYGILIHRYGPHIFHTNDERVYKFLSRFTEWTNYHHTVRANINGTLIPVPFNLTSLEIAFPDDHEAIKDKLIDRFGEGARVTVNDLRETNEPDMLRVADYIYQNIYSYYSKKQWDTDPDKLPLSVTGRVPIFLTYRDGYFTDKYEGMPKDGYTVIFDRMLDHENIDVMLNTDVLSVLNFEKGVITDKNGNAYNGKVIFSGAIDGLFGYKFGRLPYRTVYFEYAYSDNEYFQPFSVINYTVSEKYTRITEFKRLTGQQCDGTTVAFEFSKNCKDGDIPYYPIQSDEAYAAYEKYRSLALQFENLILVGRLGAYRYFNMDAACAFALETADRI